MLVYDCKCVSYISIVSNLGQLPLRTVSNLSIVNNVCIVCNISNLGY